MELLLNFTHLTERLKDNQELSTDQGVEDLNLNSPLCQGIQKLNKVAYDPNDQTGRLPGCSD